MKRGLPPNGCYPGRIEPPRCGCLGHVLVFRHQRRAGVWRFPLPAVLHPAGDVRMEFLRRVITRSECS